MSINRQDMVENLKDWSFIAQRTIHDHLVHIGVTHLHETSRMSAEFVFRYGPKCMGGVILPILVLLHL